LFLGLDLFGLFFNPFLPSMVEWKNKTRERNGRKKNETSAKPTVFGHL